MSLASWKREFYKCKAWEVSKDEATAHSLLKWRGLLEISLRRHNCRMEGKRITDGKERLRLGIHSCAICSNYFGKESKIKQCKGCPILIMEKVSCFTAGTAFSKWRKDGDPRGIIKVLERLEISHD